MPRLISALLLLATTAGLPQAAHSQWQPLPTNTNASIRGLSVANDSVIWASGQRGTVLRSIDGGDSWNQAAIPGAERFDVRSIHARSALVAHAAATAGRIWRTIDGGTTWSLRYQASDTSVFLDAIVFFDDQRGMALGDPIDGRFLLLVTEDGGDSWREAPHSSRPEAASGEAAFAASGTSLAVLDQRWLWLGTGGTVTRVFRSADSGRSWQGIPAPLATGSASTGVFSVAFADSTTGIAVGGDYQSPDSARQTAAFTRNGGLRWQMAESAPRGYRSGVAVRRDGRGRVTAVAVGTSGSDVSYDGGRTWAPLAGDGYNAVQFAPDGTAFAAGSSGRIARLAAAGMGGARP